jgi:hypothetical protein
MALLPAEVRRLFRYLSVFAFGPIHVKSIAGITQLSDAQVQSSLACLAAMGLIDYSSIPNRITVPSLLCHYARYLLQHATDQEETKARQAHLEYYLQFANQHAKVDREAHDKLAATLPNLLMAFQYAIETNNYQAMQEFGFALCINSRFLATNTFAS